VITEKVTRMSSCNIIINQPTIEEAIKVKHPGRVASGKRLSEWNRKNPKKRKEKITLESMIADFEKELEPAGILIAMKETIRILKEEHNTDLYITMKKL
jgi:hypothetical protein